MDISTMDSTPRDDLIAKARSLGVERPELMTRVELTDEIVRRSETDPIQQKRARGWLGVARDLVASVVESGLNLPDAAAVIRGERAEAEARGPTPVATVTLAEIYATQGHRERALAMLDEVLTREPEHEPAQRLRERLQREKLSPAVKAEAAPELVRPDAAEPASLELAPTEPEPMVAPAEPAVAEPQPAASAPVSLPAGRHPAGSEQSALPAAAPNESDDAREPVTERPLPTTPSMESAATLADEPFAPTLPLPLPEQAVVLPLRPEPLTPEPLTPEPKKRTETATPERPLHERVTLVVVRSAGPHPLLCWDLAELSLRDVTLEVVCYAFRALRTGAERTEATVSVREPRGSAELSSFDATMLVRAALGVRTAETFLPVAVASELALEAGALEVRFRPPLAPTHAVTAAERALLVDFAG